MSTFRRRFLSLQGSAVLSALVLSSSAAAKPASENEPKAIASNNSDDQLKDKARKWASLIDKSAKSSFSDIRQFLAENPSWPGGQILRQRANALLPTARLTDEETNLWFESNPPQTPQLVAIHARALLKLQQTNKAELAVRDFWKNGSFGATEERDFLKEFGRFITQDDHISRLNRLLWQDQQGAARRVLARVDQTSVKALAEARLALAANGQTKKIKATLEKVLVEDRKDPGLVYELVRWNRRNNKPDQAAELLMASGPVKAFAKEWWVEQETLTRYLMEKGRYDQAYTIARSHGLETGESFARAEQLAGWLALRKVNKPEAALEHFTRLYSTVTGPATTARGAYWLGRVHEALGHSDEAKSHFQEAAQYATTFYGQYAAKRIHGDAPFPLPSSPEPTVLEKQEFDAQELVRAVRLLQTSKLPQKHRLAEMLLKEIGSDSKNMSERSLSADLASELGYPWIAISIAKAIDTKDATLLKAGHPVRDDVPKPFVSDARLLHAVMRQESAFNPLARSPVGARGLMQVMPLTAKEAARQAKLKHTTAQLANPAHNMLLGGHYICRMLDQFEGSVPLALAAYNAGPGNTRKWLGRYGDPRGSDDALIDWIMQIPLQETRLYVQYVQTDIPVYNSVLNGASDAKLTNEYYCQSIKRAAAPKAP